MDESIATLIKKKNKDIEAWFNQHSKRVVHPFFSEISIKNGEFKLQLSHTQLFPMGLNNLCKKDLQFAKKLIKKYFKCYYSDGPRIKNILVLATVGHSNPFYYESIHDLYNLFKKSRFGVQIGTLETIEKPVRIKTPSKKRLEILPLSIDKKRIKVEKFDPDFIYLSFPFTHDLTSKLSDIEQPINPPLKTLHHSERKNSFLMTSNKLMTEFAQILNTDPWIFKTEFQTESQVNFEEKSGIEKVLRGADVLFGILDPQYRAHHVETPPSIRILNNLNIHGMGIISATSSKELVELLQSRRSKRLNGKTGSMLNDVLIQEEIPTSGEIVVYLIGNEVVGGYNKTYETPLSRKTLFNPICLSGKPDAKSTLYSYAARIGNLALTYEVDKIPS